MFDGNRVDTIIARAFADNRTDLMEHETYELLEAAGLHTSRRIAMVHHPADVTEKMVSSFPGEKIVLKVAAPLIQHKTDVGGVRIVDRQYDAVRNAVANMLATIPDRFEAWVRTHDLTLPEPYSTYSRQELLDAVARDIRGIMITDFTAADETGFGYQLLVGLRDTREFGPVITAGIGGIDTELFAASMKTGLAAVTVSVLESTPDQFIKKLASTVCYQKISGQTRNGTRVVTDETLLACFDALFALGRYLGPDGDSSYRLKECEINPFVFARKQMIPLDGLAKFEKRPAAAAVKPLHKLVHLLHPASMAVIGVSGKSMNMGRIILRNVMGQGFDSRRMYVIKPDTEEIDGIICVPSIGALPETVDLLVLAVDAAQAPGIIEEAASSGKVQTVIIIPGGLGEKSGTEAIVASMNRAISESRLRPDGGPLFVGGNCLGIISRPASYDTLFVPEQKLPKNYDKTPDPVAFLSQSGARMITVISQQTTITPLFSISTGNQMDVGISDFLAHMADHERDVRVFAVYVEGFRDLGGLKAIQAVRRITEQGRAVVFYKAGRTAAGRSATAGHTASVAGNYEVCATLMEDAGAIVCDTFTEFNELTRMALALADKDIGGMRLAAISNAGYETVGIADNIEGRWPLTMAGYTPETIRRIQSVLEETRLNTLVDVRNPMDLTPMGNDFAHDGVIRAQLDDPNVDCYLAATIPLTPAQQTLPSGIFGKEDIQHPDSYPNRLIRIFKETRKPMIVCIDSGSLYDPMVRMLENAGLIVFRCADLAVRLFAKYIHHRLV
ncbi:acetate--CoA ligase family protein [bacterium]|nr:acetate--CoA ligase family protein [candidate division CSSED10-310 bacterium]